MFWFLACIPPDHVVESASPDDSQVESVTAVEDTAPVGRAEAPRFRPLDSTPDSDPDSGDAVPPDTDPPDCVIRVFAVRHAEKESDSSDPGLTEEGAERAQALVPILADEPLVAVYATEKLRTQETVQPTADDHGLPVQTELDPEEELAAVILADHCGDTLLHGGHSYTLEDFFEALGGADVPGVSGYGQLWSLTITDGVVTYEMSTYGD